MNKIRMVKQMPIAKPLTYKKGSVKIQGFDSVDQYLQACDSHGFIAKRNAYSYKGNKYCILTCRVKNPSCISEKTGMPIISTTWHLIDADETRELTDGIVSGADLGPIYFAVDEFLDKVS